MERAHDGTLAVDGAGEWKQPKWICIWHPCQGEGRNRFRWLVKSETVDANEKINALNGNLLLKLIELLDIQLENLAKESTTTTDMKTSQINEA